MEEEVDLSGVDPTHWAETRRRVKILREWCATPRHSKAEGEAAAHRMGVSVNHFARLVRAWREHGEALRISGSPVRRGQPRAPRSVPAETHEVIAAAIETFGPGASFSAIRREAERRCRDRGMPAASMGIVHRMLMRARQRPPTIHGEIEDRRVLIGRVTLLLPVTVDGATFGTSDLVLSVVAGSGVIVTHRLALLQDVGDAAAQVLADALNGRASGKKAGVTIAKDLARSIASARPSDSGMLESATVGANRLLSNLLGSYLDSLPIRHNRGAKGGASAAKPLQPKDAEDAVRLAIEAHNQGR